MIEDKQSPDLLGDILDLEDKASKIDDEYNLICQNLKAAKIDFLTKKWKYLNPSLDLYEVVYRIDYEVKDLYGNWNKKHFSAYEFQLSSSVFDVHAVKSFHDTIEEIKGNIVKRISNCRVEIQFYHQE